MSHDIRTFPGRCRPDWKQPALILALLWSTPLTAQNLNGSAAPPTGSTVQCQDLAAEVSADGRVTDSQLLSRIQGAAAGTTGGLGRRLLVVTDASDKKLSKSHPPPYGTLRWAVERARAEGGGWIVFDPSLQDKIIRLEATLRLPSKVTIDGGCRGIRIVSAPQTNQMVIADETNVIIGRLSFAKEEYREGADKIGDAVSLSGFFDRIAILHNVFERCGDGCVDVIRKERLQDTSRVTVAFNRFSRHNKVMLVGTLACYGDKTLPGCEAPLEHLDDVMKPSIFVTMMGNVFRETSQRHPKVVSNAVVHLVNNLVSFGKTVYADGEESAVYGAATGTGGILVADGNLFINPTSENHVGAGTVSAVRGRPGGPEPDGLVAARDNIMAGNVRITENLPERARSFLGPATAVPVTATPDPNTFIRCLEQAAGPQGLSIAWPTACSQTQAAGSTAPAPSAEGKM